MRDQRRPAPTSDLDSPEEIAEMVRRFYADVAMDDLLGPMFNDVARVDWSEHLPKLTAFWCRALLGLPGRLETARKDAKPGHLADESIESRAARATVEDRVPHPRAEPWAETPVTTGPQDS